MPKGPSGMPHPNGPGPPNGHGSTHSWHLWEKENFAGTLIGAASYGVIVVLFFRCMDALISPANTRSSIKWGLVAHTMTMFSFITLFTAFNFEIQSSSYINNRSFVLGPLGYQFMGYKVINAIPSIVFMLNNWLADGLLVYRCYVVYAKNYRFIIFPCIMYLACVAMSIRLMCDSFQPEFDSALGPLATKVTLSYYLVSLSLNVLLTFMIITRLVLHGRNIQDAMGSSSTASGLYKAVVTILIESCALYAVSLLLFIVPYRIGGGIQLIFFPILASTEVIAPFLIILRVANQTALTSDTVVSGNLGSIHFLSRGRSMVDSETVLEGNPVCPMDPHWGTLNELGAGVEDATDDIAS